MKIGDTNIGIAGMNDLIESIDQFYEYIVDQVDVNGYDDWDGQGEKRHNAKLSRLEKLENLILKDIATLRSKRPNKSQKG